MISFDVIGTILTIASSVGFRGLAFDDIGTGIAGLLNLTAVVTVITFLIWTYRVVANVRALGPETTSASPAWAVGCYFTPILALYRPYQIMQEAWRASDPGRDFNSESGSFRQQPAGSIVIWWWACWLLYIASSWLMIVFAVGHAVGHLVTLRQMDALSCADSFVAIMKSVVAIRFVSLLTARQEEVYRRLTSSASGK
jgi:hypothetical protein